VTLEGGGVGSRASLGLYSIPYGVSVSLLSRVRPGAVIVRLTKTFFSPFLQLPLLILCRHPTLHYPHSIPTNYLRPFQNRKSSRPARISTLFPNQALKGTHPQPWLPASKTHAGCAKRMQKRISIQTIPRSGKEVCESECVCTTREANVGARGSGYPVLCEEAKGGFPRIGATD